MMESIRFLSELNAIPFDAKTADWKQDFAAEIVMHKVEGSLVEATDADLEKLAAKKGIDIPDALDDLMPRVTQIVLAIRFLFDIINVNKDYKNVNASNKTKLYAFKLIALMSKFGVSAVCVPLGGLIGTAIPIPYAGTLIGAAAGAWFADKVSKRLKPHFHEISLWLLGFSNDDLFYLRNKIYIDKIGISFKETANSNTFKSLALTDIAPSNSWS